MAEFDVTVRHLSGETYVVKATPDTTIAGLKALVEKESGLPAAEIKFVYRGKILKAGDERLKDHNITADTPICMVHQKLEPAPPTTAPTSAPASTPTGASPLNPLAGLDLAGLGGAEGLGLGGVSMEQVQQAMSNPGIRQQMASLMQNPEVLRAMLQTHPLGRQLTQQNPQLAQMLANPEMAAQLGNMMSMLGGLGGGAPAAGGGTPVPGGAFPPLNFSSLLGSLSQGSAPAPAPTAPSASPEEQYRDQLEKLGEMGFVNKDLNIQALTQAMGNVDLAVEKLLSWMN